VNAPEQKDVPAFPRAGSGPCGLGEEDGMTLRDYFAAKAMQAILSPSGNHILLGHKDNDQKMAFKAYGVADAMIAMRDGGAK
jgi:hypothetical protein